MKNILDFKGLSKIQKKELKKLYIKTEWKSILISYIFIILSSSKPFFSSSNGAIFVLIWFTLSVVLSITAYVNQSDYLSSTKKAKKYKKRHKNIKVNKILNFYPEIGGWTFIAMQISIACLFYIIAIPLAGYLQFGNLEIYNKNYKDLFLGIFADTYVVAFCNGIVKLVIETIYDFIDGKIMLKEIALKVTLKNILLFLSVAIIMGFSFHYYVNKEFSGLFGEITREYMGIIYITFIIYSNIKKNQ